MLLLIFSLFFGLQISLFVGLLIGYAQVFSYLDRITLGVAKAVAYESKWPFKNYKEKPYFVSATESMGGNILNQGSNNGGGSVGQPINQPSAPAGFSAF